MQNHDLTARAAIEQVLDRWMNDPSFKKDFVSNPRTALQSCGIVPNDELLKAMKTVKSDTPVEQLQQRISKMGWGGIVPIVRG